jgi:hypothetical protein
MRLPSRIAVGNDIDVDDRTSFQSSTPSSHPVALRIPGGKKANQHFQKKQMALRLK